MVVVLLVSSFRASAAPFAAYVMDARSGEVLFQQNAETPLHPASLTKMMTLYVTFEAIRKGEISLDTKVTVSQNAANEPPSKLGLKAGQQIELRYLIRAAAVKSANDAATAIGEAVSGSETAFANRMTRTAKAMGMTRTTFKNANGLTQAGHMSTARDMSLLGRHLLYDYPQYYNLFSRVTTNAKLATVRNTNRRFLSDYKGADGIKTGFTNAAGFNLVASAERDNTRIIATVFGGTSTAQRNAKAAELLDLGFRKARPGVPVTRPAAPTYVAEAPTASAKTLRVIRSVSSSPRPKLRPMQIESALVADGGSDIDAAVAAAVAAVAGLDTAALVVPDAESRTPVIAPPAPTTRHVDYAAVSRSAAEQDVQQIMVSRVSTSGGRNWGITIGRYRSNDEAERVLLKTALAEMASLDGALRKVARRKTGFEANFVGLTRDQADLACRRLSARGQTCTTIGPG